MAKSQSPLVGYNTNIRHNNKLYHIQTEDSGIEHPHIITHLFVDGGRIIATRKTDYSQYLQEADLVEIIRKLMMEQHKAMAIALRDCEYDDPVTEPKRSRSQSVRPTRKEFSKDLDAFEKAADAHMADSIAGVASQVKKRKKSRSPSKPEPGTGSYHISVNPRVKAHSKKKPSEPSHSESIFGSDVTNERSLDEVILSYLKDDIREDES